MATKASHDRLFTAAVSDGTSAASGGGTAGPAREGDPPLATSRRLSLSAGNRVPVMQRQGRETGRGGGRERRTDPMPDEVRLLRSCCTTRQQQPGGLRFPFQLHRSGGGVEEEKNIQRTGGTGGRTDLALVLMP